MESYYGFGSDYGDFGGAFGGGELMAMFGLFLVLFAITTLVQWAISAVWYILRSIGLYKISENRGMSGSALAWIPFIGAYRTGSIADDIVTRNGGRSYYRHILLIGAIVKALGGIGSWLLISVSGILSQVFNNGSHALYGPYGYNGGYSDVNSMFAYWGVSGLLALISLAVYVFTIIALYKIYNEYRPMSATLWTVLSVFFAFMHAIFPFILRNAVPVGQWNAQGYYPMQTATPNQNWQTPPPQYPPYGQQSPVNGGYPPQNQGWQAPPPPPADNSFQPPIDSYQPPVAPNPPEPWEIENSAFQPPERAPWERNDNNDSET